MEWVKGMEDMSLDSSRQLSAGEILALFSGLAADPGEYLIRWKERNGKKIIGCFPMDLPEEIVHASGMLPVVMWESNEPITLGHARISPYNCGIVRSVIDDGAKGKLDFLDGIVTYETCLQARHLDFILRKTGHQGHFMRVFLPGVVTSAAGRTFMVENLARLKEELERFGGREIRPEDLRRSVLVYNENRGLLRRLYQLRRSAPGLLKAKEVASIVHSSMLMPKEEHSRLLRILLEDLERREANPVRNVRVILSGSLCEAPRPLILDLIEEAGMVVVDDDLYIGSRYFANDADADLDPLDALAGRYLERIPPSPTKVDSDTDWGDYIVKMARENRAAGVISLVVKFCPPHLAYYPDIDRKVKGSGISALMLEMEHEVSSVEQVKTRLQAFRETLERS